MIPLARIGATGGDSLRLGQAPPLALAALTQSL